MNHSDIIDTVIPASNQQTRENVRKMIPTLIQWAKLGRTDHTYGDFFPILGYKKYSGIGLPLGYVEKVLEELRKRTGEPIPTLNALCNNSQGLPSYGFEFIEPAYNQMTDAAKRSYADGKNQEATSYSKWDWVLHQLGLNSVTAITTEKLATISKFRHQGGGGEGREHKSLKEYIAQHPEKVSVTNVKSASIEHPLPSGDRIDVYFELNDGNHVVVEVKPSTSPDEDVSRGVFQCVKYKSIIEAMDKLTCGYRNITAILVCGGKISQNNKTLAENLEVSAKALELP